MKKILAKISVLLLTLFTLVSCNKYNFIKTFNFNDKNEMITSLENAKFIDDLGKSGIYMYSTDKENDDFKPASVSYTLEAYTDLDGKKNMTSENLKLKRDAFRVSAKMTFDKESSLLSGVYVFSTRNYFNEEIITNYDVQNFTFEKVKNKSMKSYKYHVGIYYKHNVNGKVVSSQIGIVSSNFSISAIEEFCELFVSKLEYVQISK